jgi:hypothetical protein
VLEDGRHPVYITMVDTPGRTVESGLVQFLTDDAAVAAYAAEHSGATDEPYAYYIENENPRLRQLPVAAGVTVTVISDDDAPVPRPIVWAELPERLAAVQAKRDTTSTWGVCGKASTSVDPVQV